MNTTVKSRHAAQSLSSRTARRVSHEAMLARHAARREAKAAGLVVLPDSDAGHITRNHVVSDEGLDDREVLRRDPELMEAARVLGIRL